MAGTQIRKCNWDTGSAGCSGAFPRSDPRQRCGFSSTLQHLARCWAACLVMKFGKTLAVRIKPALREHAIDYKALKRQIRHVVEELR